MIEKKIGQDWTRSDKTGQDWTGSDTIGQQYFGMYDICRWN